MIKTIDMMHAFDSCYKFRLVRKEPVTAVAAVCNNIAPYKINTSIHALEKITLHIL